MNAKQKTIAYVAQSFPSLTTMFMYREINALKEIGFNINTFATWKPDVNKLSAETKYLVDESYYVFPISKLKFLRTHLYFLITRPVKYISTLFFVLTRKGEKRANRYRTFLHFLEAIYLAVDVKKTGAKHIHAHFCINAATIALVISRLLGISFSFTVHNIFFTDRILLRDKLREAGFIISISNYSRDFLVDLYPQENIKNKFHVIHCGVSSDDFCPAKNRLSSAPPLLFSVSQLAERKGYPVLIEACKLLVEQGYVFKCIIAGNGPQEALLRQMIARYQLEDYVELPGIVFQEKLKTYLKATDIFILPCITAADGDKDGVPMVLMEAMAMQIPVISTYVSGIPELIDDEQSGLLVLEQDVVALANAIKRLLDDEGVLKQKLGQNGRQKIVDEFNIYKNAQQLAEIFVRHLGQAQ